MALEFNKTSYLKIYTGEDVLFEDIPLYKAILREARSLGLAGGTVIKGIEGYATKVRGVGRAVSTFISGNANFPVIVELVDKKENLEKILPFLEKNATHALVVMGEADYLVTDFIRKSAEGYKDIKNGSPQPSYLRKQQEQQQ